MQKEVQSSSTSNKGFIITVLAILALAVFASSFGPRITGAATPFSPVVDVAETEGVVVFMGTTRPNNPVILRTDFFDAKFPGETTTIKYVKVKLTGFSDGPNPRACFDLTYLNKNKGPAFQQPEDSLCIGTEDSGMVIQALGVYPFSGEAIITAPMTPTLGPNPSR